MVELRIISGGGYANHDGWVVVANWHGKERVVFDPRNPKKPRLMRELHECFAYREDMENR